MSDEVTTMERADPPMKRKPMLVQLAPVSKATYHPSTGEKTGEEILVFGLYNDGTVRELVSGLTMFEDRESAPNDGE